MFERGEKGTLYGSGQITTDFPEGKTSLPMMKVSYVGIAYYQFAILCSKLPRWLLTRIRFLIVSGQSVKATASPECASRVGLNVV